MLLRQGHIEQQVFRTCYAWDGQGSGGGWETCVRGPIYPGLGRRLGGYQLFQRPDSLQFEKRPITVSQSLLMEWYLYVDPDVQCPGKNRGGKSHGVCP